MPHASRDAALSPLRRLCFAGIAAGAIFFAAATPAWATGGGDHGRPSGGESAEHGHGHTKGPGKCPGHGKPGHGKGDHGKPGHGKGEQGKGEHGKPGHGKGEHGKPGHGKGEHGKPCASPVPVPSVSTSIPATPAPSVQPSESLNPTPGVLPSEATPGSGGSGGGEQGAEELPVTGASLVGLLAAGALFLLGGAALVLLARRRARWSAGGPV
jgi:LPXTG-motif cell wall-anchored protein